MQLSEGAPSSSNCRNCPSSCERRRALGRCVSGCPPHCCPQLGCGRGELGARAQELSGREAAPGRFCSAPTQVFFCRRNEPSVVAGTVRAQLNSCCRGCSRLCTFAISCRCQCPAQTRLRLVLPVTVSGTAELGWGKGSFSRFLTNWLILSQTWWRRIQTWTAGDWPCRPCC